VPPVDAIRRQAERSLAAHRASERQFQEWLGRRGSMLDRPRG
jgi:hypothetical protein